MAQHISKCELTVDGRKIRDFSEFSEEEIVLREQVPLMNSTGHIDRTPRYQVNVTYVPPAGVAEFDWDGLVNGTLVVEYSGGGRVRYSGVCTLKRGARSVSESGDKAMSQQITLGAEERKVE